MSGRPAAWWPANGSSATARARWPMRSCFAILSLVHPLEVFRTAATHRAAAIVPFHNHPYWVTPRRASTTSP